MTRFARQDLVRFGEAILAGAGVEPGDARTVAELLVKADLNGYPGHGIFRIPVYIAAMRIGKIQCERKPVTARQGKATAVINGNFYLGQIIALQAMRLAVGKASACGIGAVCVNRAAHCGRLADYVEIAADHGMVGIAAASVGSINIPPYGGMEPFTGTNPMAFGIPGKNGDHILLDFATAASSMSELRKKAARGEPIEPGLMLDGRGMPTTEFKSFMGPPRGVVLPFGGFKGAGLNLVTEILGGLLSGHGPGRRWADHTGAPPNGLYFQALSVDEFHPLEEFLGMVKELKAFARARKRAPGFEEILLPGERSRKIAAAQSRDGIEIESSTWERLLQCADELGIRAHPNPLPEPA